LLQHDLFCLNDSDDDLQHSESLGLLSLSIALNSKQLGNKTIRELDLIRVQARGRKQLLRWLRYLKLAPSKRPNRVGVSLPSPEDGTGSSFRNVAFWNYLGFRTTNKVHNPSDSECFILHVLYPLPYSFLSWSRPKTVDESSFLYLSWK
jgi:hypothetical protein